MNSVWKELVLKWLNCFGVEKVHTVKDVKNRNFLQVLSSSSILEDEDEPFKHLLLYLHEHYPRYDATLLDHRNSAWGKEEDLYLVSSLLLLHASIFHPSQTFQQNAATSLNGTEQNLIVEFLQSAMCHEQNLSRQKLLDSIPVSNNGDVAKGNTLTVPKRRSLNLTPLSSPSLGSKAPLEEFLSSPVARQKRLSVGTRDRMFRLEVHLEQEQAEKQELKDQVKKHQTQIAELMKKYQEKLDEVKLLQDDLKKFEESHEVLNKDKSYEKEEKRRLDQRLLDSEKYIDKLAEEIESRKIQEDELKGKLSVAEERADELLGLMNVTREELATLKQQMSEQAEENAELRIKCSQLERDYNQIQIMSPTRPSFKSPSRSAALSPVPAPESLGFIVENEIIEKEKENFELQDTLRNLKDELEKVKVSYSEVESNYEAALLSQKKYELRIDNLQKSLDATSQELSTCKREKEDISSSLSDVSRGKEILEAKVKEIRTEKDSLVDEQKTLEDLKHSLEVQVALLNAKLTIAEEREKEQYGIAKEKISELSNAKQKICDLEVDLKKSLKGQELLELQFNEMKKKLQLAKDAELEKIDLEEQVINLQKVNDNLEKQTEHSINTMKTLEKKLQTLVEDKTVIEAELEDVQQKKNNLSVSLKKISAEKVKITSENIQLQKDKVHCQAQLEEALKNVQEAKDEALKEASEKKVALEKLAEAVASNDVLTSHLSISTQQETDLNHKIEEVTKQKKSVENQLSSVLKEKDKLESSLHELSSKVEKVNEEKDTLNQKLKDKTVETENVTSTLSSLETEKVNLETMLATETTENQTLKCQLSDLKDKLKVACKEVSQLKAELQEVQQQCEESKSAFTDLESEKTDLEDDLGHYVSSLNTATQENLLLKAEVSTLKEEKSKVALDFDALSEKHSTMEMKLAELISELTSATNHKESLTVQLSTIAKEKEDALSKLNNLQSKLSQLQCDLAELKNVNGEQEEQLTSRSVEIEKLQKEHDHEKKELLDRISGLQYDCEEKCQQLSILKQEFMEVQTSSDNFKAENQKLIEETQVILNSKCALEEEVAKYISQVESLTQEKHNISEQLLKSQTEKDDAVKWIEAVEIDKKSLSSELDSERKLKEELLSDLQTKSVLVSELQATFTSKEKLVSEYEERLSEAKSEKDSLLEEISSLLSKNETLSSSLDLLSAQKSNKETEYLRHTEELSDKVKSVTDEVERLTLEKQLLEKDMAERNDIIEKSKESVKSLETELSDRAVTICELKARIEANETEAEGKLRKTVGSLEAQLSDKSLLIHELEEKLKNSVTEAECKLSEITKSLEAQLSEKTVSNHDLEERLKASATEAENKLSQTMKSLEAQLSDKAVLIHELEERLKDSVTEAECKLSEITKSLEAQLSNKNVTIHELEERLQASATEAEGKLSQTVKSLEAQLSEKVMIIHDLEERIKTFETEQEQSTEGSEEMHLKVQELSEKLQASNKLYKELLDSAEVKRETLDRQIEELQGSIEVKEDLLSETHAVVEKLRTERDSLKELLTVKDQIISCHKATASSLERQSSDELDVAMKLLEGELHTSQSASEKMAQDLKEIQKNFDEEKNNLMKALEEAKSSAKSYQKEAVELKQQLSAPRSGTEISELEQEEKDWQINRVKHQQQFQFDSMMTQKVDVEEHLSQLREIIKEVSRTCDNLFAALPTNCDAVHEVTVMRKEVEMKLRAVDKKYSDSLCDIISLAHEMFRRSKKPTQDSITESHSDSTEPLISPENNSIENRVMKSCEAMTTLTCDVRSAINSCKFLIERCESFLKAQTRESLRIKPCVSKDSFEDVVCENSIHSNGSRDITPSQSELLGNSSGNKNNAPKDASWSGESEAYSLLKKSHEELEKQISDLNKQLKESKLSTPQPNNKETEFTKLQEQINDLKSRPTQTELDDKLKELHVHYSNKLETMKLKMKQIVKDEVEKVEEEKRESEKEVVAKYSKRINEFEEHVQQLSAQLWKLGEKLLQEQQDHKNAKDDLTALKERQRQYLMTKHRTQSLDRLDVMLQGPNNGKAASQLKRRCNSQVTQGGLASSKVHPKRDMSPDAVDEGASKRSTMMAPASMGLAFPEEDEDGEMFNNDYLAELKEGRCRVPLDTSRLSELQYRNSLCPPHLKSSYPVETQFHDTQSCKDEDIKGPEGRARRQGKDRGTTSYKKPGPPTPSKKAGRLSLQGKEDLTPRVAALREHNESISSQGTGMLRVAKTTPSRLRALFTSSKVANAATLPAPKKDESANPATPTSKRLSIFRRTFGGNKENQNASTGYASFR